MRLSDVLSKHPNKEYKQIDGFLINKKGMAGQKVDVSVGSVAYGTMNQTYPSLNFHHIHHAQHYLVPEITYIRLPKILNEKECKVIRACYQFA